MGGGGGVGGVLSHLWPPANSSEFLAQRQIKMNASWKQDFVEQSYRRL